MSRVSLRHWLLLASTGVALVASVHFPVGGIADGRAPDAMASATPNAPPSADRMTRPRGSQSTAGHAQSYGRTDNLLKLLQTTASGSDDAASLTLKARALDECWVLAVSPHYLDGAAGRKEAWGAQWPIARRYIAAYRQRCGDLARDLSPHEADVKRALDDAAAAGSAWARARLLVARGRELPAAALDDQLDGIIAARDPDALIALSDLMAWSLPDSRYASLSGTPLAAEAWTLAACDLGADCYASGDLMRRNCVFGGRCFASVDYRDALQAMLSPADFSRVCAIEQGVLAIADGGPR